MYPLLFDTLKPLLFPIQKLQKTVLISLYIPLDVRKIKTYHINNK